MKQEQDIIMRTMFRTKKNNKKNPHLYMMSETKVQ